MDGFIVKHLDMIETACVATCSYLMGEIILTLNSSLNCIQLNETNFLLDELIFIFVSA